jgi:SAM-dependent methyltransferase
LIKCRVCGNRHNNRSHILQERYFGLKDEFEYVECGVCKSLSIVTIPRNMERYYPAHYYSFTARPYSRITGLLKARRDRYYLFGSDMIGHIISLFRAAPQYIEWLRNLALPYGSSILDVGCGSGTLIVNLQDAGFPSTGIDPNVDRHIDYPNGAKVLRQTMEETNGIYHCIMLHHSIEHMPSPYEIFHHINRLLRPNGKVLIRMPVADKYAWKIYGRDWFQIDAPRHFIIMSEQGLRKLAEEFGFKIEMIAYDSTASQFWASEQYARNIAHNDESSYAIKPKHSIFSIKEIEAFAEKAERLNQIADGDQAAFYLIKDG